MASTADLERWKAAGGSVDESGKRKVFVAPGGKRLRAWKEAAAFLETAGKQEAAKQKDGAKDTPAGRKRAHTSPDVATKEEKDGDGKRRKSAATKRAAAAEASDEEDEAASDDGSDDVAAAADGDGSSDADAAGSDAEMADAEPEGEAKAVGSGRVAAQGRKSYKEAKDQGGKGGKKDLMVAVEPPAKSEDEAWEETAGENGALGTKRRLLHFVITDDEGQQQPLELMDAAKAPLKLSGAVYPATGPLNKPLGRQLPAPVGPVTSWSLTYSKDGPALSVVTAAGTYELARPDPSYRKVYASLEEQARLAWHVLMFVEPSFGGTVKEL